MRLASTLFSYKYEDDLLQTWVIDYAPVKKTIKLYIFRLEQITAADKTVPSRASFLIIYPYRHYVKIFCSKLTYRTFAASTKIYNILYVNFFLYIKFYAEFLFDGSNVLL